MKSLLFSLSFICLIFCNSSYGQGTIKGTIIDVESLEVLIGAHIYTPNTNERSVTDFNGNFSLTTNDSILRISYTGYVSQEVPIDSSFLTIALVPGIELAEAIISVCSTPGQVPHKIDPSISYLNTADIQINNETNIASSLNLIPGVFMHSGALNTNRITIRGIGNRNLFGTAKIKAYLDGIPLTNGSGETALENIDLSIVDAVSVYKGPASSIYGAGLGGMINLQLPNNIFKNGNHLSLKNTNGSFGLTRSALTFTRANYDRSVININLNGMTSDGYRDNNHYRRYGASAYGKLIINDNESVTMLASYTFLRGQIPSSLDSTDYVKNPEQAAFIWDRARGFERSEKATVGIAYQATIREHLRKVSSIYGLFSGAYEVRPFNILNENSLTLGARTEWILDYNFDGWLSHISMHFGGEIFREKHDWQTYQTEGTGQRDHGAILSDNKERRNYSNLFAQAQLDFDNKAFLKVGVNKNYTDYEFEDFYLLDDDQSGLRSFRPNYSPFINLGINLDYLLNIPHELNLSATVSHGFSPPTLQETLTPEGAINPAILVEQGWNYELGLKGSLQHLFDFHLSVYSMQIKDLLVARRTNFDQFVGINAGKTAHNGLELGLDYNWVLKNYRITPFLRYTYSDYTFKEFIDEETDHSGNALTGTAPHLFTAGVKAFSNTFYGNIVYRFVDAMPMRDDNSIYSDAYQLVNLKLGYTFKFSRDWTLDIFTGVNNVFDERYASMILINAGSFGGNAPRYFYPGLPRNFYLGLSIEFR